MIKIAILLTLCSFIVSCNKDETQLPYLSRFDFDNDNIHDTINYSYSGGAHCCYQISLFLSSSNTTQTFPFQIDGGYIGGFDDSKPDTFFIKDFDNDGLPEIYLKINTYNGDPIDIPIEWQEAYNIQTHYILIDYYNNKIRVIDFPEQP
ncbi:MAG: hypothetical protein JW904_06655 [Spirochaetales bacterium]|nr:hypothetical protein [Spirochaetales bacterium]